MKRYCLTLDLKDEPSLIQEYTEWHTKVWPEVVESIEETGICDMEIYRLGNRLFMIMETDESFSFERKATLDNSNAKVQEWEKIMWKYQQSIPGAKEGEKWILMNRIFSFKNYTKSTIVKKLNHG